jgi:hypothetical protein
MRNTATWIGMKTAEIRAATAAVRCGRWRTVRSGNAKTTRMEGVLMAGKLVPMRCGDVEVLVETRSVPGTGGVRVGFSAKSL